MEWSIVHQNEFLIEGNGAEGKGDKNGQKRPRDDDGDKDSDRGWQQRCDAATAKYAKLFKPVEKASAIKAFGMMVTTRKVCSRNPTVVATKAKANKAERRTDGLIMSWHSNLCGFVPHCGK